MTGSVYFGAANPGFAQLPARSRYLEQVRQIAPRVLTGRERDLAELAVFCTAPDPAPAYVWWQAPAWAGKSALMAWFVLNPPPGVRVVSLFITARYAGQDNHVAFTDVVVEQLAELLDQPMPANLSEATRAANLLGLLAEAAHVCGDRGERLVLEAVIWAGLVRDVGERRHPRVDRTGPGVAGWIGPPRGSGQG